MGCMQNMKTTVSAAVGERPIFMDPGSNELESGFSQLDNPCLIVEDSQPDSAALEEDPDSSYRSLFARSLSNLQPTSPSPVLELISSPLGSKCSQTDSLANVVQRNTQPSSACLESTLSSDAREHSQILEVCSPSNQKSVIAPVARRCAGEEMEVDAGADSTTQCAQSEGGPSQFGFLELSESQGPSHELDKDEESQAERASTPPSQTDSQRQAKQGAVQKTAGVASGSQVNKCKRSEVSSSCPSEPSSGERKMSIQDLLHGSEASAEAAREPEDEDEDEVPSSQDDLFDAEKTGGGVDSTVAEPESQHLPTCTPAHSLRLLHLSGHGILVQESLSQNSADFVAPTQDGLSQTPLIVPNSPTAQEDEQAFGEPMDTSLPPDEPDCLQKRGEEPMDMDQAPVQSGTAPKPQPSASTPVSQHSPGFVLEKNISVPTLPELSHDVFVPTQSQETGSSDKVGTLMKEAAQKDRRLSLESGSPEPSHLGVKRNPSQSLHSEVAESFQLELSTLSERGSFAQPSQKPQEAEDSQATQIEESGGLVDTSASVTSRHSSQKEGNGVRLESEPKNTPSEPKESQTCEIRTAANLRDGMGEADSSKENSSQGRCSETSKPTTQAMNVTHATDTTDLTKAGSSQKQDTLSSQQKIETIDLTKSSQEHNPPSSARSACVPYSLSSSSESQSVLHKSVSDLETQDMVMEVQSKIPEVCVDSGASVVLLSQNALQKPANAAGNDLDVTEDMEEAEKQEETTGGEGSGLCLSLSQSQALSPEPMEEECVPSPKGQSIRKEQEQNSSEKEESSSVVLVEESERVSQQKGKVVTSQTERGVAPGSPGASPALRKAGTPGVNTKENTASPTRSQSKGPSPSPDRHSQPEKAGSQRPKPADVRSPRGAVDQGVEISGSKSLSDSSGEIPFHFTLPKEGEFIGPVASATPPLISQLKQTPRHSTPIERSAGDVTKENEMAASEITVEESREATKEDLSTSAAAEPDGKLSLRMKLVTPVEEGSSGSERFSLQKPALSEEEGSVSKVTTVVKAVTSPKTSNSVFSRVCEARRQVEVEERALPSMPCTPTRGDLYSSPLSQERDSQREAPRSQGQRPKNLPGNSQSVELSASPREGGLASPSAASSSMLERAPRRGSCEKEPHTETLGLGQAGGGASVSIPEGEGPEEGETNRVSGLAASGTSSRQRAVSQQTSFDMATTIPSPPSKMRQRAVSQQTSFEAAGPQYPARRGEPEMPPLRAPAGQSVRRHVRTIREVRTTVTRIITDVYYENGQEVERKVTEESEEPVVDCRVVENEASPSRTGSSMTSGDLADISSLSSKASSLQHSSSGTSSGGPGPARRADFIVPSARGAKFASPRKGSAQQQRGQRGRWGPNGTEERERAPGALPLAPLTPRGRARRGRPPSRGPLSRGAGALSREDIRGPPFSSSEEDEAYTRVCAREAESGPKRGTPSRSVAALDSSPDSSGSASSFVGLRVVAKWLSNGYLYSGCITRDLGAGRFRLLFDDGYECDVPGKDILLCDPIPVETEVTALSDDECFSTGVVKGHKTEGSELFYSVEKDGQCRWYGRMSVILSMEQANRLREQYGLGPYEPATPLTKASDISLDNLVEGKRKRRGNAGGGETPSRSSSDSPRTPGPSGKRKLISAADEIRTPAKRGRKSAGARTGKHLSMCNTSGSGTDLPSDPNDLVETHGPLPPSASLFLGYAFLLTTSSERDRETNQLANEEEEYVQTAPYNKSYTEQQLEAGGGFVLQEFNEGQCKAAYQSLLIADQHCRTRKYLQCLASGVPCVSHIWVRDCCHDNQLLNYRNYLLPAGVGLEGRVVEWHPRRSPFEALKVLLVFDESAEFWTDLLKMGGAASVCNHEGDSNSPDALDLVVTNRSCPPPVLKRAASLGVPVLSPEWVIQSLVCGERQGYSSHAQFQHDYSP
ncbi:TP53-binding protein 1 isoform X3 [Anguilla anguilla]|uniref:TP53-binding protein 1 isoform X3 n=1 Tax=Anguilla anguilla TaxID=7936 RepID=UPI0015A97CC2|nr:TP53-binding protein 1 isoform X3 [Anguilla anguilla]